MKHARYYWPLLAESHLIATPVRNDAPADLDTASRNGLRRGECKKNSEVKKGLKGGRCPRNAPERKFHLIASQCESG